MADPKYADLPGIAYDQPDVYETSDLPEADQNNAYDISDNQSEVVEKLNISVGDAYDRFKGKSLDSTGIDFSDRISKTRRTGYDARSGDWELACTGEKETPVQKYQRLRCEIEELLQEVAQVKETIKGDGEQQQMSPAQLSSQVEILHKQLIGIKLEDLLGSDTIAKLSDPHGTLQKKLLAELQLATEGKSSNAGKKDADTKSTAKPLYELFYRPKQAELNQHAKSAELDKRLERIEKAIGATPDKLSSLAAETNTKSLVDAISVLDARSSLLDPTQLDHVESRLSALNQKMNQIAERKSVLDDAEKQNKISELYDLAKKSETTSRSLPDVVARLSSLCGLHEQALQFGKGLTQLDTAQQQVAINQQVHQKMLREFQENFGKDVEAIQKNIASMEKRISTLQRK